MAKKRSSKSLVNESNADHAEIKVDWTVESVVATVVLALEPGEKIDLNQLESCGSILSFLAGLDHGFNKSWR